MQINKYYIVKRSQPIPNGFHIDYARGYGNWSVDMSRAKRYSQLDSVRRLIKGLAKDYPNMKTEILYVTEHVETVNDILEKEIFDEK